MEINENGVFSAVIAHECRLDGHLIVCPRCGADRGLAFTAFAVDRSAVVTCPNRHTWDESRMNGKVVRDLYLSGVGQPTRCGTVVQDPPNAV